MKSSDYFSEVYGPKHKSKKMSRSQEKRIRAIQKAASKIDIENMLNWLYDSTNLAFERIPESVLRSFVPDVISFRFFHKDSRNYIEVQLIKYLPGTDQFFLRNRKTQRYEIPFQRKFSSVPEYFRKKWDDPITHIRDGYFETEYSNTLKERVSYAGISENECLGKYKAVFEAEVGYCSEFKRFTRKL